MLIQFFYVSFGKLKNNNYFTMKKIFVLLVFLLGFSLSISAQEGHQAKAKELALKIKNHLNLDDAKTKVVYEIINHKYNAFQNNPDLIDEKKQLLVNQFTKKLENTLSPDEFRKLKSNKNLFSEFQSKQ